jgi:hypothetical protein
MALLLLTSTFLQFFVETSPASEKVRRLYLSGSSNCTPVNFLEDRQRFLSFEGVANVFLFIVLESNIWQVGSKENCTG